MAIGEWQELNPPEKYRYYIKNGSVVLEFQNVKRIKVSQSGNHYLEFEPDEMVQGTDVMVSKAIVHPDAWDTILLDVESWTF